MSKHFSIFILTFTILLSCNTKEEAPKVVIDLDEDRIKPYTQNPRYWQYQGKPILLLGGTKDDNLFQISGLESHLDDLRACGGNYIRNTMSSRNSSSKFDQGQGTVSAFRKLANGKYDLDQWNEEYWQRLANMLELTRSKNIIPQIEIWAFHDFNKKNYKNNPWRPENNINYHVTDTKLTNVAVDVSKEKHAFFLSVPGLNNDEVLLGYQQRFVDKLLSYTRNYNHILYCITNEIHPQFPPEWGWFWAKYIKNKAAEVGKAIEVTEMFWHPNLRSKQQKASLKHPEIYSYFEASQNSANEGQENGDNLQFCWDYLGNRHPRPINNVKIYGADSGPPWAKKSVNAERRFWRNIVGGSASSRFHRPVAGIGLNPRAKTHLKSMRLLTNELNIFMCKPDIEYTLLTDRDEDEAYLIYETNSQYAVYFPDGGAVGLDLKEAPGRFRLKWLDISNGSWLDESTLTGGRIVELSTPKTTGHWTVLLKRPYIINIRKQ